MSLNTFSSPSMKAKLLCDIVMIKQNTLTRMTDKDAVSSRGLFTMSLVSSTLFLVLLLGTLAVRGVEGPSKELELEEDERPEEIDVG
jgi:hypothetical protein